MTRPEYLRIGLLCGLDARETMRIPPGMLFDLWTLYARQHGLQAREDGEEE